MTIRRSLSVVLVAGALGLGGCQTQHASYDYSAYERSPPTSILVLPPLNHSTDLNATYGYLSTVSEPLAEHGFYVFPVAVVDEMFRQNGLPTAGEIHQVPLAKMREIFGADAVLYPVVEQYGTKFHVLSSDTVVRVSGRLVDTRSGTVLWEGSGSFQQGSGNGGGGGALGALVNAVVSQVINSSRDAAHPVARLATRQMIDAQGRGLPYGPHSPLAGKTP